MRHALRSAVKRGEAGALSVLGYGGPVELEVKASFSPRSPRLGESVKVALSVANRSPSARRQWWTCGCTS